MLGSCWAISSCIGPMLGHASAMLDMLGSSWDLYIVSDVSTHSHCPFPSFCTSMDHHGGRPFVGMDIDQGRVHSWLDRVGTPAAPNRDLLAFLVICSNL